MRTDNWSMEGTGEEGPGEGATATQATQDKNGEREPRRIVNGEELIRPTLNTVG